MAEQGKDANTKVEEQSVDEKMDKILDDFEASSASKQGDNKVESQDTGADQSKNANLDKETDTKSSPESKLAKIKEILGDDEEAINSYIKSKGYHKDPAWQALLAKSKSTVVLDEETKKQLEEFKKVTSSREFIEAKMKAEGYKQDTIDAELKKRGFEVTAKLEDDVDLILKKLNISEKDVDDNLKATISDIAKVFNILYEDRTGKVLPEALKPFQENLVNSQRRENASKIVNQMKEITKLEGILDYDKDIKPEINKFLEQNPEALQEDVFDYFNQLNHQLSLERLKTGKKRAENEETKTNLRKVSKSTNLKDIEIPKKTGDFHTDADALLDVLGVQ